MQQSTPVSAVGSDSVAGQLPSNEAFRNVQQVCVIVSYSVHSSYVKMILASVYNTYAVV